MLNTGEILNMLFQIENRNIEHFLGHVKDVEDVKVSVYLFLLDLFPQILSHT